MRKLQVLDVVALLEDLPNEGLSHGQVGTLVEELAPGVFEVEFADTDGRARATLALRETQLLHLLHDPVTGEAPWGSRPTTTKTAP